jgi:outer membrane biosynthesis protein TonB
MRSRGTIGTVVVLLGALASGCAGSNEETRASSTPTAQPRYEETTPAGGGIDAEHHEAIERVLARKIPELQACWQEEYEKTKNRKLEGNVSLMMVISPSGKASKVDILESTIKTPSIEQCVVAAVRSWSFPEGKADVPVRKTVHLGAQF